MKLCDIMNLKEKQAAAKQTFVFLGSLANEYPAKQDVECDSTDSCSFSEIMSKKDQKNGSKKDMPGYGGKPRNYGGNGGFII